MSRNLDPVSVLAVGLVLTAGGYLAARLHRNEMARRERPPALSEPLALRSVLSMGPRSASVAVVVFSDFECVFCGAFARNTLPEIVTRYVKSGKILLGYVLFPLDELHPRARRLAHFGRCAAVQGKFWPVHDLLFAQPGQSELDLLGQAQALGIQGEQLRACMSDDETERELAAGLELGRRFGVVGTPTTVIGVIQSQETVLVTEVLQGAVNTMALARQIEKALARAESPLPERD